jgi:hypothetical protein
MRWRGRCTFLVLHPRTDCAELPRSTAPIRSKECGCGTFERDSPYGAGGVRRAMRPSELKLADAARANQLLNDEVGE